MNATTSPVVAGATVAGGTEGRCAPAPHLPILLFRDRHADVRAYRVYLDFAPDRELIYIGRITRYGKGWDVALNWTPVHGYWPTKPEAIRYVEAQWWLGPGAELPEGER